MNKESTRTAFPAGDFISENAVRGVFSDSSARPPSITTEPVHAAPANPPDCRRNMSPR